MKYLITLIAVAAGCCASAGELADLYHKKVQANLEEWMKQRIQSRRDSVVSTNHGITELGIERTLCFGTCPAYTFIVKSDGTFRYVGEKYAQRQGAFTGTIPTYSFHRLARFIKDSGYMELSDTYDRQITDNPTVFTMVVMDGKQKVVSDYAGAGPSKLWAIEKLIDDLMVEAHWNEPPKPENTKK